MTEAADTQTFDYDVVIIGGGMVGASLACALANTDKSIAVVEPFDFDDRAQPSFDDRSIALAYGSRCIWEAMGLWESLEPLVEPIRTIHVSDRGHLGATRLYHHEENVEALGYVAENRVIGEVLMERVQQLEQVHWLCPASLETLEQHEHFARVGVQTEQGMQTLTCRLVVAADGAMSRARELCGLEIIRHDYRQTAVIANVETEYAHDNVAYERFTDSGPLAFLPMTRNRCSVVWTIHSEDRDAIMELDDDAFVERLQERFGFRLGHITRAGQRHAYPLAYLEAEQLTRGRVVIIGNAAHALHPVSGQGYNLALRDVAELAQTIAEYEDPGHTLLLSAYHARRRRDIQRVYRMTDSLVKIFSNRFPPLAHARAAGLIVMDLIPSLRHLMARQSMGMLGPKNKMMRRLPL